MGILLSKLPEQESAESSETTNDGSHNRSRSANRKRRTSDRETDEPTESRKKPKSSHETGTFSHTAKSGYNDAQSGSNSLVTLIRTKDGQYSTLIANLDSSTMSSSHQVQGDSRHAKKPRRKKMRSLENKVDCQSIQLSSHIETEKLEDQDQNLNTPATPKKSRGKRKAPTSPYFLESPTSPALEEKKSKKKSKISVVETALMPASLPHFRPTSSDEFGLIQEKLRHDPWRMLVAVIFLNVTTAKMALPLLSQLLERWPTPEALSKGTISNVLKLI